ncbi:glycosyltransferase family 4 protein [Thalassomonas actiniarum]|uniref:Glycosyltransferase family 4 protein n=1 Tax=Thalassomonas actiniarum TaxID=485447 RepID=A0AAF0C2U8_9GAMM|nr:glycosyltransferase family 4 protein [Thalassomonas actiniarum]WDE00537.1 glycosyltransferase family 4 protein [Thalassomonas actiniarum]
MKIVLIANGNFIHIQPYIDFYNAQGYEVSFISLTPSPKRNVKIYEVLSKDITESRLSKILYLWCAYKARKLISEIKPDLIHAQYATSGGLVAYLSSGKIPYIITAHGSDVLTNRKSKIWSFLFKKVFGKAVVVNSVSEQIADYISSIGTLTNKQITASIGIDLSKFNLSQEKKNKKADKKLKLICTRRFEPIYNHEVIFQALILLQQSGLDFEFTFVGHGPLMAKYKTLVDEHKLNEQVSFLGQVPNGALPELLNAHDIYISSSLHDGTSLCLLEAFACGLFPIVSDIESNKAWVQQKKNGLLFETQNAKALADAILAYPRLENVENIIRENIEMVGLYGDRNSNINKVFTKAANLIAESKTASMHD